MNSRWTASVIAVVTLLAVAMGCSSAKKATTPTALSNAQLEARYLALSDLGAGWRAGSPITPNDISSFAHAVPCSEARVDSAVAQRLTPVSGIQFEATDGSSRTVQEFGLTGDPSQLHSDLQALIKSFDACAAQTATTTETNKLTVKRLAIPNLGDQRAGYVLSDSESLSGPTLYVRNAAVRVGSVLIGVGLTEIHATAQDKPQVSDDTFVKIVRTAVDKLSG